MNVKEWLDDIEWELEDKGFNVPDRHSLLRRMNAELAKLSSYLPFDTFYIYTTSILTTTEGTRYYDLPTNFGTNFVREGDEWACMLDNGSNETNLDYISASEFFKKDLSGQSNSVPTEYTILTQSSGLKQFALSPPPDSNSDSNYTINGLYVPTDWSLSAESTVPAFPANSPLLKLAVLRRLAPITITMGRRRRPIPNPFEADYQEAFKHMSLELAKQRRTRIQPAFEVMR